VPGIFSELRAAGTNATFGFLGGQVRLGQPGSWRLAEIPVQLTLFQV